FFSSRRRHTRSKRDWSSDVCSSDLYVFLMGRPVGVEPTSAGATIRCVNHFARIAVYNQVNNGSGGADRAHDFTGMNRTLSPAELRRHLAPQVGFEPTTDRLTADCSTTELLWNNLIIGSCK